jgi:hypothetical protein
MDEKHEMIWNEAQMFARDLIAPEWHDVSFADLPPNVREAFVALISEDVPRSGVVHELRKDAERYRWLRENYDLNVLEWAGEKEKFDAAVDAAMKR